MTRKHVLYVEIECEAPDDMFLEWEDISEETKQEIEENGSIPCEGGGHMGMWCQKCRFGTVEIEDE